MVVNFHPSPQPPTCEVLEFCPVADYANGRHLGCLKVGGKATLPLQYPHDHLLSVRCSGHRARDPCLI
jgi:hypothetical protein